MSSNATLGISGEAGSFSEEAGLLYAQRKGMAAQLVYLTDMEGVLAAIEKGKIETGIFPVVNSRGGLVKMAFQAMGNHLFQMIDEVWLEVRQSLLVQPGVKSSQIDHIVSHTQALAQCERYLQKEFRRAELTEWQDTAKAAHDLALGKLGKTTAVIASERCAHIYGLEVLARNIQDSHPNLTTFIVVKKHPSATSAENS